MIVILIGATAKGKEKHDFWPYYDATAARS